MSRLPLKFRNGDFDFFVGLAAGVVLGTAIGLLGLALVALAAVQIGLWNHYDPLGDAD